MEATEKQNPRIAQVLRALRPYLPKGWTKAVLGEWVGYAYGERLQVQVFGVCRWSPANRGAVKPTDCYATCIKVVPGYNYRVPPVGGSVALRGATHRPRQDGSFNLD